MRTLEKRQGSETRNIFVEEMKRGDPLWSVRGASPKDLSITPAFACGASFVVVG